MGEPYYGEPPLVVLIFYLERPCRLMV
jgi:hypothetical protein